jgi:hypothetical protein
MPQPLPRYEPLGIRVGSVQPISTAAEEAGARSATTLAENLTRMSNFAFEQAAAQARVEGAEYGAANAPTIEQLKKGQETGQDVMPGNTSSIFGRAARDAGLKTMQQNIEIEARSKLSEFDATARRSDMPLEEYRKQLDSIVVGYSSALAQVSPATAGSVRAALTVLTSSSYTAHAKHLYDKAQARDKIAVTQAIDNVVRNVDTIVQAGGRFQGEAGDEIFLPVDHVLAQERNRILEYSYRLGDAELAKTKLKEFQDQVNTSLRNGVVKYTFGEDGVPTYAKLQQVLRGEVRGTPIERLWSQMSEEDRTKTKDEIRRQLTAQQSMETNMEASIERARTKAVGETRIKFITAWRDGDVEGARNALTQMDKNRDAEGYEKYSSIIDTDGGKTQPGVVLFMENELARGKLTRERVMDAVTDRRLSFEDGRKLLDKVNAFDDKRVGDAMTVVKNILGFPDRSIINPSATDRRAMQRVTTIQNEILAKKAQADAEDKPFDAVEYGRKRAEEIRGAGPSAEQLKEAENRITGLRSVLRGKGYDITNESSLEDVRAALATANSRQPNERGYFNPAQSGQYIQDIKYLLDAIANTGAR